MDIHWNHMLNMMGTLHTPQGVNTTVYENNSFCSLQLGCVFMRRVMLSPFNNILPKINEWKNMEISVKIKNEKGTISPGRCTRTVNIYCNLLYTLCWLCTPKKTTAEIQILNEDMVITVVIIIAI